MKDFWKSVLYVFLRTVMVCFFSFMSYILVVKYSVLAVPFGIFYFVMMMYFFVFTMWYEGGKDINRVKLGTVRYAPYKGFAAGGVVGAIMTAAYFLPSLFTSGSLAHGIVWLVKEYFMLPTLFLSWQSVEEGMTDAEFAALKEALQGTLQTQMAVIYFVALAAWIVGAGVGYIVGYKQIKIFQPFLDKWKRD